MMRHPPTEGSKMKKPIHTLLVVGLSAAFLGVLTPVTIAAEKAAAPAKSTSTSKAKAPAKKKRKVKGYPFRGKLGAVDKVKHTITVTTKNTKRVFPVNDKTKFIKNGKPAKITDGVIGEEVAGYVLKLPDGKLMAKTVRFGPKPKGATKGAKSAKSAAAKSGGNAKPAKSK